MHVLHIFWHMVRESVPLFLMGALFGALVEAFVKQEWIERWMGRGHRSVAAAAVAGAILPGCAMSTMPLAQSLHRRGAASGTIAAFIMIAPVISPHTIFLTATLVSVPMAVARVALSFVVAVVFGGLVNAFARPRPAIFPVEKNDAVESGCCGGGDEEAHECCGESGAGTSGGCCSGKAAVEAESECCCSGKAAKQDEKGCCATPSSEPKAPVWQRVGRRFISSLWTLSPFLIGGLAVAALVETYVPAEAMRQYMGGGWRAYAIAAAIGIPVYVCDGGEIPLTRALLEMGVGQGPAFCFMLASVGTCLPTIAMAVRILGWRITAAYMAAWLMLSIGGGWVFGQAVRMFA